MKGLEENFISINTELSIEKKTNNCITINVNGELKVLFCEYEILTEVLEVVKNKNYISDVITHFAGRYSEDEVRIFLETLIEEGIIQIKNNNELVDATLKLCIIADGDYYA